MHTITSAKHQPTTQDTVPHPCAYVAAIRIAPPSAYIHVDGILVHRWSRDVLHVTPEELERVIAQAIADATEAAR